MKEEDFEKLLDEVTKRLGADVHDNKKYHDPKEFEDRVLIVMRKVSQALKIDVNPCSHQHGFPDIVANGFGVEVKSTRKDQWSSTGNSIFESMREANVKKIYVIFGKMGGMSSVRWGLYDNIIKHVRISHVVRVGVWGDKFPPRRHRVIGRATARFPRPPPRKPKAWRGGGRGSLRLKRTRSVRNSLTTRHDGFVFARPRGKKNARSA